MTDWNPYPYQTRVAELILQGKSVILQAPTGAGKTVAAELPFLHARQHKSSQSFPRKCIYSVPLRVLATQFHDDYQGIIRRYGWKDILDVTIQTGAQALDPKLEGDLIFSTIDQTLSNFLNIPYALSLSQGNLNAGAVCSSYLVFDELHLFDPETALPTTLHLLKMLNGVAPFLVMTATLSDEMVKALASQIDAEPVVVSAQEAAKIPSQNKTRRIFIEESTLTPEVILATHQKRSIGICNTVDRAQALYDGLKNLAGSKTEIQLLHSRFLQKDRQRIEEWLKQEFGKDKDRYTVESAIFIATQVVEVGVDITSQTLHTELAPAANVIQRAGRCARYEKEIGDVYVYDLPLNDNGERKYAPYHEKTEKRICRLTWEYLSNKSGEVFDFGAELALVNHAHREADEALLAHLQAQRHYISDRIEETIRNQERGGASELIRKVDSRTVIIHPNPKSIENPWIFEGFGIFRGSLYGAYDKLEVLMKELDEDWAFMTADPLPEEDGSRQRTVWKWRYINSKEELQGTLLVAVNPRLARYSEETGFQLGVSSDFSWESPIRKKVGAQKSFAPYKKETIQEHVGRMLEVYRNGFFDHSANRYRLPLFSELDHAMNRLEAKFGWSPKTLNNLVQLVIVLHDVGKLDIHWQKWAHKWQEEVSKIRGQDLFIQDEYMAAHTDYDSKNQAEKIANDKMRRLRPNHAAESAVAGLDYLFVTFGDEKLVRAALTAIVRHHAAGAKGGHGAFQAHSAASSVIKEILASEGFESTNVNEILWNFSAGEALSRRLIKFNSESQLLIYLLLCRALRLADQRSQEL